MSVPADEAAAAVCDALLVQAADSDAVRLGVLKAAVGILVADAFAVNAAEPGVELEASLRRLTEEVRRSFEVLREVVGHG